ncbi:putative MerR-family transcriptional regulator [Streptomyces viridochromogenes Tue57]|uniref:Putative MerR-family transcriptional regulator n=1 Tax=Streptomyces viridochromogenes Tue57 TaxID=1160705 RepID=L8PCK2_STRVR|nr:putative MerR-family transcriptional regulator [Streptomyces viridochromogenes Tue57]
MAQHQAGEHLRQLVHVFPDPLGRRQDLRERDALADQGRGDVEQAAADVDDLVAVGAEVAEVQGGGEVLRGDLALEAGGELLGGEADRLLLGGRGDAEQVGDVPAVVEGLGQFRDAGEGVAAFQQGRDRAQAGQVVVVVPGDTALAAGRRYQLAFPVETQGAHRDAGQAGQLFHAVLTLLGHPGTLVRTGGNFPRSTPTGRYGPPLLSPLRQRSLAWFR